MLRTEQFKVALVGRANVGKSTLFNRLVGKRKAIDDAKPGTTRDLVYGIFEWGGKKIRLIDSGGLAGGEGEDAEIRYAIQKSRGRVIKEADVVLLVCDSKSGILGPDEELAAELRRRKDSTILVVNKVDSESQFHSAPGDFYRLGLKEVIPISAAHGLGIYELCEKIISHLPSENETQAEIEKPEFSLAIIGEPNVGKSTYLNAILASDRATVSAVAGTTRDPVEDVLMFEGRNIRLVDTAGARRNRKVNESVVFYSQKRTMGIISEADVVLLFMDTAEGLTRNGLMLAEEIVEQNKSCVLVVNKWDLTKDIEQGKYRNAFYERFKFLRYCPLIFVSAKDKKNIHLPIKEAIRMWEAGKKRIEDRDLIEVLSICQKQLAPGVGTKIKFATQVDISPPHFVLFSGNSMSLSENYLQSLRNELTERFNLGGIFFKMTIRRGKRKS